MISYYDRVKWDTISHKGTMPYDEILVENGKLTFDSTMIQERVALNKTQEKELLNLLLSDTCVPREMKAGCYMPRHMILFKDRKDRIVGYNEFCIDCRGSNYSENLVGYQKFCYDQMQELFQKCGIRLFVYFGHYEKEINFLKSKGLY